MEKIKVLVVEDKLLVAEDIANRLRKHDLDVVGTCTTGEEAIAKALTEKPDLILMDIELDGAIDGISAAKLIQEKQSVPIIFLSDYKDDKTLARAKKAYPVSYITKPFLEPDLIRAIDLAFSNAQQQGVKHNAGLLPYRDVFLREKESYMKIAVQDILYLKADRAYCKVVTVQKEYTLTNNMNHVFQQLLDLGFIRVHRSYCVNVNRITALDGNMIKFDNHEIQMSKEYRDELLGMLKIIK